MQAPFLERLPMKSLTRREFVRGFSLFGTALYLGARDAAAAAFRPAKEKTPNIIVILTDDSGYTDLGCYGGEIHTPNIDSLARNGMRFTNFYSAGRCSPTRASLLTGRDSAHAGFAAGTLGGWQWEMKRPSYRARLAYNLPTIPELLGQRGYHTMMAGKWHLGGSLMKDSPARRQLWKKLHPGWELTPQEMEADFNALPMQRGFDRYFGLIEGENHFFFTPEEQHNYLDGNKPARLNYDQTYSMHCHYEDENRYPYTPNHGKTAKAFYATDGVTDRALDMLKDTSGSDKPFFMYLAYRAPHMPLQAPQELVDKYMPLYEDMETVEKKRVEGLKREKLLPENTDYRKYFHTRKFPGEQEKKEYQLRLALHAAMLEKVDQNVGRLTRLLKEQGQLDNTLILYFSDNGAAAHVGDMMNKPYYGCKALMWEGGTKTHCIAHWPARVKPGLINHTICHVYDIMPTCLTLAGGSYPDEFHGQKTEPLDGRDISGVFDGKDLPPAEYMFFNDKGQQGCIYKGRWKLLIEPGWYVHTSKTEETVYELYDLENDPAETTDISQKKPELAARLTAECDKWQKKCGIVDYSEILDTRPNHTQ
ncbi:Arylsulfatase [Limihaloglobus sulfuriphilus]|uniref:Arylsulfatase n=2 Tax=Limihaloglobus sulfuriphilus TaxID=1851148 RepID=A0A1Q2MH41_9BACT|nr:Arylsulfatase [Limihaloglobus sulfuriphilus]